MYHSISREADRFCMSPKAFRDQIDFIRNSYPIIKLRHIREALQDGGDSARKVVITFDDAYTDFHGWAFPVLASWGVPSTVFVPSGFIGRCNEWDLADRGCPKRPVMAETQLRALHETGLVDFGSHTVDHVRMAGLEISEMRRQAVASKRTLEDLLGEPITMFAYPYGQLGDFSRRTTQLLAQAGYEIAVTTHWGTRSSARRLLRLGRICFQEEDDEQTIKAKIDGDYDWIALKERVGFALRAMRGVIL